MAVCKEHRIQCIPVLRRSPLQVTNSKPKGSECHRSKYPALHHSASRVSSRRSGVCLRIDEKKRIAKDYIPIISFLIAVVSQILEEDSLYLGESIRVTKGMQDL